MKRKIITLLFLLFITVGSIAQTSTTRLSFYNLTQLTTFNIILTSALPAAIIIFYAFYRRKKRKNRRRRYPINVFEETSKIQTPNFHLQKE